MANILEGVPSNYTIPISAGGGIPIEASVDKELRVNERNAEAILDLIYNLLLDIRNEAMLTNDNLFPDRDFTAERLTYVNDNLTERR